MDSRSTQHRSALTTLWELALLALTVAQPTIMFDVFALAQAGSFINSPAASDSTSHAPDEPVAPVQPWHLPATL